VWTNTKEGPLILHLTAHGTKLDFQVEKILNSGYTARDPRQAQQHIEEMRREGIATPKSIPVFFPKLADRITTAEGIEVLSNNTTSGEAEFVLLFDQDEIYVGVGSDHTDRILERHSIVAAKQMCPNVISREVWRYHEVKDHWNDLLLRSWVEKAGQRTLYQEARLGTFMEVAELINRVKGQVADDLRGLVFYGGTIPVIGGEMCFSSRFEARMIDEWTGRSLTCSYSVLPITWFKGEIQVG
jgi:hypothetical protein